MAAVASAAGASTALGIAFVTIGAAVLKISDASATAPRALARWGMFAFLSAMVSSFLAMAWLITAGSVKNASWLDPLYWVSIALFIGSAIAFLGVYGVTVAKLWRAQVANILNVFAARIPPGKPGG